MMPITQRPTPELVQACLDKAAAEVGSGKAYIANYMFPEGRTCSGDLKVLEKACELVTKMGAKNAKMLNVSGAFHTPYMEAASASLSPSSCSCFRSVAIVASCRRSARARAGSDSSLASGAAAIGGGSGAGGGGAAAEAACKL